METRLKRLSRLASNSMQRHFGFALSLLTLVLPVTGSAGYAFTSRHHSTHTTQAVQQPVSHHSGRSRHRAENQEHEVTQYSGSSKHTSRVRHSRLRHVVGSHHHETHSAHTRYAY